MCGILIDQLFMPKCRFFNRKLISPLINGSLSPINVNGRFIDLWWKTGPKTFTHFVRMHNIQEAQ